eukprot:351884-Chlamydomonas_euryale.AAC.4
MQCKGINLTASENCTSTAVMEVSGSCMTNKYSEGRPLARYYGGNENIDKAELLCEVGVKSEGHVWAAQSAAVYNSTGRHCCVGKHCQSEHHTWLAEKDWSPLPEAKPCMGWHPFSISPALCFGGQTTMIA